MRLVDFTNEVIQSFLAKKLRSFLAIAGIVWGAYTVLMLSAIGQGMYDRHLEQIHTFSKPTLFVFTGATTIPYAGFPANRQLKFTAADIMRLPKVFSQVLAVTPSPAQVVTLVANSKNKTGNVTGVNQGFFTMYPTKSRGRIFTPGEMRSQAKVIVLSLKTKEALFQQKNALGKTVIVGGVPFKVIGYPEKQRGQTFSPDENYIPYTTFFSLWLPDHKFTAFRILLGNKVNPTTFENTLRTYLAHEYHYSTKDRPALYVFSTTKFTTTSATLFTATRWFLIFSGLMTLMVGGIGVANMMYFIVSERTRLIGLSMALGAKPETILGLILTETIVLIVIGGLIGMLLCSLTLSGLSHLLLPPWLGMPKLNWFNMILVWLVLLVMAVLAGFFPARKAALMLPAEALKG